MRLAWPLLVGAALAAGCRGTPAQQTGSSATASSSPAAASSGSDAAAPPTPSVGASAPTPTPNGSASAAATDPAESSQRCAERRAAAMREPALSGAETFESARLHFARVRGRSLLWKRVPGAVAPSLAEALGARGKREAIVDVVRRLEARLATPAERREAFLREGYLFADDVELALALVEQLKLAELFDEPTLTLQRGTESYELAREEKTRTQPTRYVFKDGPNAGMTAELLLGDRIAGRREDLEGSEPLAVDLRDLADRLAFDRIKPLRMTKEHLVAELRYGEGAWVPALFDVSGARANLACEELTPELETKRRAYLAARAPLEAAMPKLRAVVRAMIREELPFDSAPDQANGVLRRDWRRAYLQGKTHFMSGGREYPVYSPAGQARPPQVCIDFLTDVWERASGTWYQAASVEESAGKRPTFTPNPKRLEGGIRFDRMKLANRRSVAKFERFTRKNDELFDVWEIPRRERVKFEERDEFYRHLESKADEFRVGDMVIVHGFKEGGRPHYHGLLVTETCPVTGVISLVASNAVKPREQTLEGIMHLSPGRSLRTRIRVRTPWLELVAKAEAPPP